MTVVPVLSTLEAKRQKVLPPRYQQEKLVDLSEKAMRGKPSALVRTFKLVHCSDDGTFAFLTVMVFNLKYCSLCHCVSKLGTP